MKRTNIIILIAAITTLSLVASEDNKQTSINGITIQTKAGELTATLISQGYNPREITRLTLKGTLDERDFSFMRENMPQLLHLDISGITNSTLPTTVFANNATLSTVILPEGLTIIPSEAFKQGREDHGGKALRLQSRADGGPASGPASDLQDGGTISGNQGFPAADSGICEEKRTGFAGMGGSVVFLLQRLFYQESSAGHAAAGMGGGYADQPL